MYAPVIIADVKLWRQGLLEFHCSHTQSLARCIITPLFYIKHLFTSYGTLHVYFYTKVIVWQRTLFSSEISNDSIWYTWMFCKVYYLEYLDLFIFCVWTDTHWFTHIYLDSIDDQPGPPTCRWWVPPGISMDTLYAWGQPPLARGMGLTSLTGILCLVKWSYIELL